MICACVDHVRGEHGENAQQGISAKLVFILVKSNTSTRINLGSFHVTYPENACKM